MLSIILFSFIRPLSLQLKNENRIIDNIYSSKKPELLYNQVLSFCLFFHGPTLQLLCHPTSISNSNCDIENDVKNNQKEEQSQIIVFQYPKSCRVFVYYKSIMYISVRCCFFPPINFIYLLTFMVWWGSSPPIIHSRFIFKRNIFVPIWRLWTLMLHKSICN